MSGKREFHVFGFEPNADLIGKAVSTPDDIGKVLRVHLAIEQQLNALLLHVTRRDVGRLSFAAKLVALRALLVEDSVCDVIEKINELRNQLAHNPRATLNNNKTTVEEIVSLSVAMLPTLSETGVRFSQNDTDLHDFASMDMGQKIAVIGAVIASYLGNMPKHRNFAAPKYKAQVGA